MTAEEVGDTLFNTSKTMRYLNGRSLAGAARGTRGGQRRGFALVASLTLMMLLGLIAVGILAVASTQNRIAAQTILLAEARQQALIGLDAAISDLQMEMGPDQRPPLPASPPTTPLHRSISSVCGTAGKPRSTQLPTANASPKRTAAGVPPCSAVG